MRGVLSLRGALTYAAPGGHPVIQTSRLTILAIFAAMSVFPACSNGFTLAPEQAGPEGPAQLGVMPLRERREIIPGTSSGGWGMPLPEPGLYANQCDDIGSGGPHDGCITGRIECGQTIVGHTRGGVNHFDTLFYEKKFCTPSTTHHNSGDERVYVLDAPDHDFTAVVTLDTPCADLDLAAFKNKGGTTCPTINDLVPQCEMWPKPGNTREQVALATQHPTRWFIVVEGKDPDEEGAFSLTVQCKNDIR